MSDACSDPASEVWPCIPEIGVLITVIGITCPGKSCNLAQFGTGAVQNAFRMRIADGFDRRGHYAQFAGRCAFQAASASAVCRTLPGA